MDWKSIKMADRLAMLKSARKENPNSTYWDIRNKYNDGKTQDVFNVDKYNSESVIKLPTIAEYNTQVYDNYEFDPMQFVETVSSISNVNKPEVQYDKPVVSNTQINPIPYKLYKPDATNPQLPAIPEFTPPKVEVQEDPKFDRYAYLQSTGDFIKANENPNKKGYDKKTNTWLPYDNRTGGYGFDIISNNRIKQKFGDAWSNKRPISNKDVDNMFSTVLNDFAQYVENRYEKINGINSIKTLPNNIYTTLVDYAYQHGNLPQSLVKAAGSKDIRGMETILRKYDSKYPKRLQQRLKKLYE